MPLPLADGSKYIFTSSQVAAGNPAVGKNPAPPIIVVSSHAMYYPEPGC
jgi:hypothetical protein